MAVRSRSRISPAAARVNVTISSRSISSGRTGSVTMDKIRSTSTAVLPDPAAALTSMLRPRSSITCFCSVVQVMPISTFLLHRFPAFFRGERAQPLVSIPPDPLVKSADRPVGTPGAGLFFSQLVGRSLGLAS